MLSNLDDNTVEYLYKNAGQETCQPEMGTQSTSQLPERSGTLGVYLCHIKNTLCAGSADDLVEIRPTWLKVSQAGFGSSMAALLQGSPHPSKPCWCFLSPSLTSDPKVLFTSQAQSLVTSCLARSWWVTPRHGHMSIRQVCPG